MENSASSRKIFKEIIQLEGRAENLCKEKEVQLYKKAPTQYADLIELDKRLFFDFKNDRLKTKKEVYRLKSMVHRFHEELQSVKPTPEFLEKLKVIMEDIESNISSFKVQQRQQYDQLIVNEVQLSNEVDALEKRFSAWNEANKEQAVSKKPTGRPVSARDVMKNLPDEVALFEKFLQDTGGVRGGWDEYDHNTFLKWRVRVKNKEQFLTEVVSRLPTKNAEEVADHEEWYCELLKLQELKKLAIKQWKLKKNEEKHEQLAELTDSDEQVHPESQNVISEKERQEKIQRLNAWKLQKELKRAEIEEKRINEEKMKAEKERQFRERQEKMHAELMEYKQQKQMEEEMKRLESQALYTARTEKEKENHLLNKERVELRNYLALEQKFKHIKEQEKNKRERERKEEKLKMQYAVSVPRDPNRLLQLTEGWKSRTKEIGSSAESGRVYSIQHRAIPTWRQGL